METGEILEDYKSGVEYLDETILIAKTIINILGEMKNTLEKGQARIVDLRLNIKNKSAIKEIDKELAIGYKSLIDLDTDIKKQKEFIELLESLKSKIE